MRISTNKHEQLLWSADYDHMHLFSYLISGDASTSSRTQSMQPRAAA